MSAGPDIRVGLVEFGTVARSPQPLTSNLKAAIKSTLEMPYAAGATNTTGGYNMARDMLIAGNKGPDYQHIIVFMTDGETNVGPTPDAAYSKAFHDAGIQVVTVAIGNWQTFYNTLLIMAREDHNVIPVDSFSRMSSMTEQILERSCETEKRQCNGEVVADGLNHYFEC